MTKQETEHYNVSIETLGQWKNPQWQAQLPNELVKYGQGSLGWQGLLALNIGDDKFSYDYQINSNLENVALTLPAPFNKSPEDSIAVSIHAFGNETESTINADIGDKIDFYGLLEHQQSRFSLAHLVLGKQQLWLPTTGFHITADLAQANYEQWQPLVLDIMAALESEPNAIDLSVQPLASEVSEHLSLIHI